jgi:transketolase
MLDRALEAVEDMDLTVLYATTIVPFDEQTLQETMSNTIPNVILAETYYEGALVPDIAKAFQVIPTRIEAIGVPRQVLDRYGPPECHDREISLTAEGIRTRITRFLKTGNRASFI